MFLLGALDSYGLGARSGKWLASKVSMFLTRSSFCSILAPRGRALPYRSATPAIWRGCRKQQTQNLKHNGCYRSKTKSKHKRFKRTLICFNTDTHYAHFRGNPLLSSHKTTLKQQAPKKLQTSTKTRSLFLSFFIVFNPLSIV